MRHLKEGEGIWNETDKEKVQRLGFLFSLRFRQTLFSESYPVNLWVQDISFTSACAQKGSASLFPTPAIYGSVFVRFVRLGVATNQ